jgi:DNA-directed RNA polymerase specialized sigma24 family protein
MSSGQPHAPQSSQFCPSVSRQGQAGGFPRLVRSVAAPRSPLAGARRAGALGASLAAWAGCGTVEALPRIVSAQPAPMSFRNLPKRNTVSATMASHPDRQRVERALAGDPSAVAELVDELVPVIQRRVARALVLSGRCRADSIRTEVEDLTQEVLITLLSNCGAPTSGARGVAGTQTGASPLNDWQPERGLSLKNFVGLVAQRHTLAVLASRRRSPFASEATAPADLAALSSGTQSASEGRLELERLVSALEEQLSARGLEMFYRLYVWQETPAEIAAATGQQLDAVYQWRSRIRKLALSLQGESELDGNAAQGAG